MMALEYVSLNFFLSCDSFGCFLSCDSFGMFFFLVLCFCAVLGWLGLAVVHLSEPGINIMYNIESGRYSVLTLGKMVVS